MTWTVRIDGKPTVTCRDERSGLHSYERARRFQKHGHRVELFQAGKRVLPATISLRR